MLRRTFFSAALGFSFALMNLHAQPVSATQQRETQSIFQMHQSAARYYALQYGPFRVFDDRLELVGETDALSPRWFTQVLEDYPDLDQLNMIECPGTKDDIANLYLGRMIREAGIRTHVPAHGSVRSGAVELFIAGVERSMEPGAEFAVHSWRDEYGRQAGAYSLNGSRRDFYLHFYVDMGMSAPQARAFYAMTNSAPHLSVRWMTANEMARWVDRYPRTPARASPLSR